MIRKNICDDIADMLKYGWIIRTQNEEVNYGIFQ